MTDTTAIDPVLAVHEAGHLLLNFTYHETRAVHLQRDADGCGWSFQIEPPLSEWHPGLAISALAAGPIAELFHDLNPDTITLDCLKASRFGDHDLEVVNMLVQIFNLPRNTVDEIVQQTARYIRDHWPLVEQLTDELMERMPQIGPGEMGSWERPAVRVH